jgi:hypothetical protein
MKQMTRRDALAVAGLTIAGVLATACEGGDEKPKPEEKKETKVTRVDPVFDVAVICGLTEKIWVGPPNSVVTLEVSSGLTCTANTEFIDQGTEQKTPAGLSAPAASSNVGPITVPGGKVLAVSCEGDANEECTATIRSVEPPLPPGIAAGTPVKVQPGAPVKNPAAPPAVGTSISLDCGKNAVLWAGRSSYVTVRFKGSPQCKAQIRTDAGTSETTDQRPFCRTFGPVTSLTGFCIGPGTTSCEFQVTEVIELP